MDNKVDILLNSVKNINSVNVDSFDKVKLSSKFTLNTEYEINNIMSATEIFDAEREENAIYRIYGRIEYMSLLNGLKLQYKDFQDFFIPQLTNNRNILNSFDFYLVRPKGYIKVNSSSSVQYVREFEILARPNDFDIFPAGFSNNVYGEQTYAFNFKIDIDVSNYLDDFGFPATELFLYVMYKPANNYYSKIETIQRTNWNISTGNEEIIDFSFNNVVYGDLIEYSKTDFLINELTPQTYYINTYYGSGSNRLRWKYNPFIPFRLRYFSEDVYTANTGNTSYEITSNIPAYATKLDNNGNYVWRNILNQGYIDPLTGIGVDYPFVNKRRYLFSNIILTIIPDLNDTETQTALDSIWYDRNSTIMNITPIGDINNIGAPCQ